MKPDFFADLSVLNYSRERRIKNEQLFFEMNSRIKTTIQTLLDQSEMDHQNYRVEFGCECADAACDGRIKVGVATFDAIHAEPSYFMVKPGHEHLDIEKVIERHRTYLVVDKGFANKKATGRE